MFYKNCSIRVENNQQVNENYNVQNVQSNIVDTMNEETTGKTKKNIFYI